MANSSRAAASTRPCGGANRAGSSNRMRREAAAGVCGGPRRYSVWEADRPGGENAGPNRGATACLKTVVAAIPEAGRWPGKPQGAGNDFKCNVP